MLTQSPVLLYDHVQSYMLLVATQIFRARLIGKLQCGRVLRRQEYLATAAMVCAVFQVSSELFMSAHKWVTF